jgi:hypothetical protein
MKSSHVLKGVVLLLISATGLAGVAFADQPNPQFQTKYVFVTGSMIPQKVKVKSIGTATVSPLRVIKRHEIYQSGRYTTEDVLAQEPSLRVISGRPGPGH